MKRSGSVALAFAAALSAGGCSSGLPSMGSVAAVPSAPAAAAPVSYGAFLDGPVGQKLDPADRDKALAAEQDALATGQRKTWKGDRGTFGYVEPAGGPPATTAAGDPMPPPAAAGDTCKAFTSTIYIGGRPQVGHGRGCQGPDGTYRITA